MEKNVGGAWLRIAAVLGMLAVPLAAAGVTAVPAAAATTYTVTATIGVGITPEGVGVDPATNTVYVANEGGGSVSVIDGATNTVTATIGVGSEPIGVGVDPATHAVYVANAGGNSVSVITPVLPLLRFDAHAYGIKGSIGSYAFGPTAPADLTCTATPGSASGHAVGTSTTASGTRGSDGAEQATATSTLSGGQAGITSSGSITATATATAPGGGDTVSTSGSATFTSVKVGGVPMPYQPPANTTLHLLGGTVVLNEQTPITDAAGDTVGISVNAIDVTIGTTHVIIGHTSTALTLPGTTCPAP